MEPVGDEVVDVLDFILNGREPEYTGSKRKPISLLPTYRRNQLHIHVDLNSIYFEESPP